MVFEIVVEICVEMDDVNRCLGGIGGIRKKVYVK